MIGGLTLEPSYVRYGMYFTTQRPSCREACRMQHQASVKEQREKSSQASFYGRLRRGGTPPVLTPSPVIKAEDLPVAMADKTMWSQIVRDNPGHDRTMMMMKSCCSVIRAYRSQTSPGQYKTLLSTPPFANQLNFRRIRTAASEGGMPWP